MNTTSRLIVLLLLTASFSVGCQSGDPDEAPTADTTAPGETAMAESATPQAAPMGNVQKINLNTASEEQFMTIPGVGERMVHEFEEYRPYVSIQQFRREIGKYVDEDQVAAYEQYVFVPVSPNESDDATLMQLPGVDAETAAQLVSARPFDSNEAFLEALGEHVTEEERAQAESYLASP